VTPNLDYAKLGRFLARECSDAEAVEVRAWLAADPAHRQALEGLERLWRGSEAPPPRWNEDAAWARLAAELQAPPRRRWVIPLAPIPWLRAAAAVVLLAGSALVAVRLGRHQSPAAPMREVATLRAQRAQLRLQDGTQVTLGVDSRLRYSQAFVPPLHTVERGSGGEDAPTRDVYLEGEAYFEVAHDALRPFRVHAGNAVTRVLGTRFDVRAYAEDRGVRVVVAEGRVALGRDTVPDVVLGRGDLAQLKEGAAPVVRHDTDVESALAWVDGRLVFADTPLSDVVLRVSRWYDVDVRLGDSSLANIPYSMALHGDESPESVLRVIAAAVGARLERRGTAYTIVRTPSEAS
jgi:transmembrane sensor